MTDTSEQARLLVQQDAGQGVPAPREHGQSAAGDTPPVFPDAALCGILGEIVKAADPTTEAHPAGVLGSLLTMVSGLIGPKPHLQIGNSRHPLLIWTLLMGSTGRGRKGEAMSTARRFVQQAYDEYFAIAVGGLSTGEGLIERIRDRDEDDQDSGIGTDDKRLVVIESEFAVVLARAKREGNTLSTIMRQAWEGDALVVLNRKPIKASSSHVAVSGHISRVEFRAKSSQADMAGGSYNRFLPLHVARSKVLPIPDGVDEETLSDLCPRLRKAIEAAREIDKISMDTAAKALWSRPDTGIYAALTSGADEDGPTAQFTQRAAPYTLRIAGLYAALDARPWIADHHLEAAYALIQYAVASAQYVHQGTPNQAELERDQLRRDLIANAVDKAGPTGLTRAEVSALFGRNLSKDTLGELIGAVVKDGIYEVIHRPPASGRGRPAEILRRTDLPTKETN